MSPKKPKAKGTRGSRHAPPTNAFQKGGPPGPGRPKDDPELIEAFRARTPKALAVLDRVMDDFLSPPDDAPPPRADVAVRASEVVLNRGWGNAPSTIKLDATVTAEVSTAVELAPPDPARLARIAGVLQQAGVLQALEAKGDEPKDGDVK